MIESSSDLWPVLARWSQRTEEGRITWYLAGLRADRGFWGYVHYRERRLRDNRSFLGTFDEESFDRAACVIRELEGHSRKVIVSKPIDELVGVGTRSSFRTIFAICDGIAEPDVAAAVRAYHEFRDVVQPILAANVIS